MAAVAVFATYMWMLWPFLILLLTAVAGSVVGPYDNRTQVFTMDIDKTALLEYTGLDMLILAHNSKAPKHTGYRDTTISVEDAIENGTTGAGYIPGIEMLVLDVDVGGDKRGEEQLLQLADKCGFDPEDYPIVATPSGGKHVYMTVPAGSKELRRSPHRDYPHIDVRHDGNGYVVAAGSVIDAGSYHWRSLVGLAECPMAPSGLLELYAADYDGSGSLGGSDSVSPAHLAKLLGQLDPGYVREYDDWYRLMMAAHYATGGSAEAAVIFAEWAVSGGDSGTVEENIDKWETAYKHNKGYGELLTIATLMGCINKQNEDRGLPKPDLSAPPTAEETLRDTYGADTQESADVYCDLVDSLTGSSSDKDLQEVLNIVSRMSEYNKSLACSAISEKVGKRESKIKALVGAIVKDNKRNVSSIFGAEGDLTRLISEAVLDKYFTTNRGHGIAVTGDSNNDIWQYVNGTHWENIGAALAIKIKVLQYWEDERENLNPDIRSGLVIQDATEYIRIKKYAGRDFMGPMNTPRAVYNCTNGELWFDRKRGPKLKRHDPKSLLPHKPTVRYTPGAECPRLDEFLNKVFYRYGLYSSEVVDFVYEMFAAMLLPQKFNMEYMFVFYGDANSGKSKVLSLFKHLLGEERCRSKSLNEIGNQSSTHSTFQLYDSILISSEEKHDNVSLPVDQLKEYIGNVHITADKKNVAQPFDFMSYASLLQCTNSVPIIDELDESIRRRMVVLEFENSSYRIDPETGNRDNIHGVFEVDNTIDEIKDVPSEMSGFLNNVIDGWKRLADNNFELVPPEAVYAKQKRFFMDASPTIDFLSTETNCEDEVICWDANDRIAYGELYAAFNVWRKSNGIKRAITNSAFTRIAKPYLDKKGITNVRAASGGVWVGLRLKYMDDPDYF